MQVQLFSVPLQKRSTSILQTQGSSLRFGNSPTEKEYREKSNSDAKFSMLNSISAIIASFAGSIVGVPWVGAYFIYRAGRDLFSAIDNRQKAELKAMQNETSIELQKSQTHSVEEKA